MSCCPDCGSGQAIPKWEAWDASCKVPPKVKERIAAMEEAIESFFEVYDRDEILSLESTEFDRPIDLMRGALKAMKERPA